MIYLDNSATSYPKPRCVIDSIQEIISKYGANSGRGSYKMALDTTEQIYLSRKKVADFITKEYDGAVISVVDKPGDGFDETIDYDALKGTKITVAASPTPHAEILKVVKEILAEKDITLDIKEFTDYVQPNNVVESGEIDANYFQHKPYLDDFNKENNTHIVSVGAIHVEPIALYGGKQTTLDTLKK